MINYNKHGTIVEISNPNKDNIESKLDTKNILLLKTNLDLNVSLTNLNALIPGYIIDDNDTLLSMDELSKSPIIKIYKNYKIIKDFKLNDKLSDILDLVTNVFSCGKEYSLSLYKGEHTSSLLKNYRETNLLSVLENELLIYLFNPKHEKDIKGNNINSIKKWGIKINLKQGDTLYIPPEWYYFFQVKDNVIFTQIECDSYSTYLYNCLRKK